MAHLVVLSLPQKAEGVRGIVLAEKTKTSSQYFAGVQKLAVLDLGLVLLPVNSQSEAASLLAQLVLNNILLEPFAIYQFTDSDFFFSFSFYKCLISEHFQDYSWSS